jgi:hypothetical protein
MKKFLVILLLILVTISFAQEKVYSDAQKKLMARRAAVMDAYRQLAETIQGIKITSSTIVRDFVTEKDEIKGSLDSFVMRGAQVVSEQFLSDGTYEVTVEVKLSNIIMFMQMAQGQYQLQKWQNVNFQQQMNNNNSSDVYRAVGTGATPGGMSEAEFQRLKAENETMKNQIMALQNQLAQAQNMGNEVANLKAQLAQAQLAQQTVFKLQMENAQLKQQLAQVQNTANEVANLKAQLAQAQLAQQTVFKLQMENAQLKQQLAQAQNTANEVANLKAQLAQAQLAQQTVFKLQMENAQLKQQLAQSQNMVNVINTLKAQLSQMQSLAQEAATLRFKVTQLENEIKTLKSVPSGVWLNANPSQKLMARRAALMDGYRLLLESVEGIRIDSRTTVKDFVTESDQINGQVSGFVRGIQMVDTRYLPDGTCEVDLVLDLGNFVNFLKQTSTNYGKSSTWPAEKFDGIYQHQSSNQIKVTGTGTFK